MHVLEVESTGARAGGGRPGTARMPVDVRLPGQLEALSSHRQYKPSQRTLTSRARLDLARHRAADADSPTANAARPLAGTVGQGRRGSSDAQLLRALGNDDT